MDPKALAAPDPKGEEVAELLAARANVARSRLAAALAALERKRRQVLDVRARLSGHHSLVRLGAIACTTAVVVALAVHFARAPARRRRERVRMLRRAWSHPERVAAREDSALVRIAKVAAIGVARLLLNRFLAEMRTAQKGSSYPPIAGG